MQKKKKSKVKLSGSLEIPVTLGIPALFLATFLVVASSAASINLDEIFLGRCHEFQQVMRPDLFANSSIHCNELLTLFNEAFSNSEPCNASVDSFDPFVFAAQHDLLTDNRALYWSGPVTPLVYEYSAEGRRLTTIRDILAGYIIKNLDVWCDDGLGTASELCPFDSCGLQALGACWQSLSRSFAQQVVGEVRVMLNGSIGTAYYPDGTFAQYELPYLDAERNPVLQVLLVHNIDQPDIVRETCQNGTLLDLKAEVEKKGIIFDCTDDPLDVLLLQCVDHVDNSKCQNLRGDLAKPDSLLT